MSRTLRLSSVRLTVAASLALVVGEALAASGSFTFVTGEVTLVRPNGQRVAAQRGTEVDPGDSIVTGANGMAQLTMIDQARLSLRPSTQFRIEEYQRRPDSSEGAILSLVRGTLRTFTGLIASNNRDKFVMKTRVATVGIRGSGNILYACSQADRDCDPSVTGLATGAEGDFTVNHTIEGSHAITNIVAGAPGVPAQQGGATTLITGPGQTVMVQGAQPPRFVPTPTFITDTATNPTGAAKTPTATTEASTTRDFAPGETRQIASTTTSTTTGNLGPGFTTVDASNPLLADATGLNDVLLANNGAFLNQSNQLTFDGTSSALRGYSSYPGTLTSVQPAIVGGTIRENQTVAVGPGLAINLGRYENPSFGFSGPGSATPITGNVHFIYAPSGYPAYTSDVLTGVAVYTLAAATQPTNQLNTAGSFGTASLNVNFSTRTLNVALGMSLPVAGGNAGGSWNATASNVPFTLNSFYASTDDRRLVIVNGTGQSSNNSTLLSGAVEGSFVGTSLQGAILGYGIADFTSVTPANHNLVTGVVALTGVAQNGAAPYREGRVSDPQGFLAQSGFSRAFSTTNRPEEVVSDAAGGVSTFVAPHPLIGPRATYALGSAQVVQSGIDAETGLVWGRWGNGIAQLSGNGSTQPLNLTGANMHYVFAGVQQGPPQLPLTGAGVYDVIGSTSPTDGSGHTGTLGSATLNVDFSNRTAASTVNVTVNGQNWIGTANSMPIYRDQYFSASTGSTTPGVPNVSPLGIGCSPSCGQNATGSFDGFFTGRTGQRAGMLYNMGGVQGAVAFGRRGAGG